MKTFMPNGDASLRAETLLRTGASRRTLLRCLSNGFGMLAFQSLAAAHLGAGQTASNPIEAGPIKAGPAGAGPVRPIPMQTPRARNVILCFMDGGPSHVDTFDYKPELSHQQGKPIGDSQVSKLSQSSASRVWLGSPWKFRQRGQSGLWVSDLLPHTARLADELCVVRSLVGKQPLHGQQNLLLHTGRVTGLAPSIGSWVTYGLGTENKNLPGYVLLNNDWIPNGGLENFSSAFLPAVNSATLLRAKEPTMDNVHPGLSSSRQSSLLSLIRDQDETFAKSSPEHSLIESAIRNYETAFQMQTAIPELADVSKESKATQDAYGLNSSHEHQKYYALQCLRARRLVEAGVRFVEITCPLTHANNSPWDQHGEIKRYHEENARITDQSVAALIHDLKLRGLLDETMVIWAGEMGRTPHTPAVSETCGRDHHVNGYTIFVAGGGFRGGITYGRTDDFGNSVAQDPLTIHDIHATVLHQLGIDHKRLTVRFGGRDVSLTDVHGTVVQGLLRS